MKYCAFFLWVAALEINKGPPSCFRFNHFSQGTTFQAFFTRVLCSRFSNLVAHYQRESAKITQVPTFYYKDSHFFNRIYLTLPNGLQEEKTIQNIT